ncbi:uncharacterized protein LOC143198053 [Rhynchophorus ferrugineus]|uniref:Cation-dependent mannose-6-phosphate receptor n=1 Tax=Rhynchophorus ferrugineus TaxID=354439 RepID=A0A834HNY2_RHYFE|nr:hypothetical protein GWI33_020932 [Rhynchophorus ferrugineus]
MAKYFVHVVVIFFFLFNICNARKCVQKNSCACEFDEYSEINIKNLIPNNTGYVQDSELDINSNYTVTYFFSGCKDTTIKNHTASLFKCETKIFTTNITNVTENCYGIGKAEDILYMPTTTNPNEYQITYNKTTNIPSITLICIKHSETLLKIKNNRTDQLYIFSQDVCLKHLNPQGLSTGSVFCIIFFTTAVVYFLGGGLILYFARGARGVEVIPNYDFWASIPGLVKDGTIYILSGCRPFTVSTAETYDRI